MIWFLILLVSVFLFIIYLRFRQKHQFWQKIKVVCTDPTFVAGHVWKIILGRQSFFDFNVDLYNDFPNRRYNGYYLFLKPVLVVRDLDLIKQICIKDFDSFSDHLTFGDKEADRLISISLFNLCGQEWKKMRSTLNPTFTTLKMKGMFPLICENAENLINYLSVRTEDIREVEMRDIFDKFTIDVIASTVFGVRRNTFEDPENDFYKIGIATMDSFNGFQVVLSQIAPSLYRLFGCKIFPDYIMDFFSRLVKDNIKQREKHNIVRPDMIQLLLEARKGLINQEIDENKGIGNGSSTDEHSKNNKFGSNENGILTDDSIVAQAILFFFTGFDTVSSSSSFMAYELALNPDVQDKLRKEITDKSTKCNGNITYEELFSMKYLDQVVSETLRKWPPGFDLERICLKDYDIRPITKDESLLTIRKGQKINIPVSGIHRCPKYFPDPMKFDPERFSDENKTNIVSGSYLPFGIGPRNCIGSRYALLQMKILFFYFLPKFELVPIEKTQIPLKINPKQFAIGAEKGFWLGIKAKS